MRANELELLRASGVEPCLLMDNGGKTGRLPFSEAALALRPGVNLFPNWYFPNPVNQQGLKTYTGYGENGAHSIDCWTVYNKTVLTQTDSAVSLFYPGNADDGTYIMGQALEQFQALRGEIMTLSLLIASLNGKVNLTVQFQPDYTGNVESGYAETKGLLSTTFTVPEDATMLLASISSHGKIQSTLAPVAMKIEPGDHQTLARKDTAGNWILNDRAPNPTLELLKCQRYFQVYTSTTSNYFRIGFGIKENANRVNVIVSIPTRLRISPAVIAEGSFILWSATQTITSEQISSITLDQNGTNAISLFVNTTVEVANSEYQFIGLNVNTSKLIFDAQLN